MQKVAIGILTAIVALVVTVIGWKIQESIATQNTGKDYLQIALGILEQKDLPEEVKKNKGLRTWAVELLNRYSQVKLDPETSNELINGETNIPTAKINDLLLAKGLSIAEARAQGRLSGDLKLFASFHPRGVLEIDDLQRNTEQTFADGIQDTKGAVFSP